MKKPTESAGAGVAEDAENADIEESTENMEARLEDILGMMTNELASASSGLSRTAEALGRLSHLHANLCSILSGISDFRSGCSRNCGGRRVGSGPHPLEGQVEPGDGANITLKDVVREIFARSRYRIRPDSVKFRTVDDGDGTKVVEFRIDAHLSPSGSISCHAVESFTVYLHSDLNRTVAEFDSAVSRFHAIRVPLKSEDHGDWCSLD